MSVTNILKNQSDSAIQYFIVTTYQNNFITNPNSYNPEVLDLIRNVPRDLRQFNSAFEYYSISLSYYIRTGLSLLILPDNKLSTIRSFSEFFEIKSNINQVKVFLFDSSSKLIRPIVDQINESGHLWYMTSFNNNNAAKSSLKAIDKEPNYFNNIESFIKLLKRDSALISKRYPDLELLFNIESVRNFGTFNIYYESTPSQTNYSTINQMFGNYWMDESKGDSLLLKDHFSILLEQSSKIDSNNNYLYGSNIMQQVYSWNPYYEPLILVAPYHNPTITKFITSTATNSLEKFGTKILLSSQDKDYQFKFELTETSGPDENEKDDLVNKYGGAIKARLKYLDCIAYLHASFTYSPVIRLPLIGSSINRELSLLKPSNYRAPRYNEIHKFGKKFKDLTLNEELEKYIEGRNGQIVAISDLPIEWLDIKGVPLCFTHDVCRMPEVNYGSLYKNYSKNQWSRYDVPEDILSKTLIILGASGQEGKDEGFKKFMPFIYEVEHNTGIQIRRCLSVDDVAKAVNEIKPELLIFDCHGGFDEKTLSSYLVINGEILTGNDIVEKGIFAPLVFLSACNTTPNYGYLYPIGEDFLYAGAYSVTTTFNSIQIGPGFGHYLRLIENLEYSAKHGNYKNWLEFVTSMTRSLMIYEAYTLALLEIGNVNLEQVLEDLKPELDEILQNFKQILYRRQIFQELQEGKSVFEKKVPIKLQHLNGEYLSYSHLGRPDLIMFSSWINNKIK